MKKVNLALFEIANVLVRLDHVASFMTAKTINSAFRLTILSNRPLCSCVSITLPVAFYTKFFSLL
jgi:hypothetical protein